MRNHSLGIHFLQLTSILILLVACSSLHATEPNDTFATATVLSPGVLTAADDLTPADFPDTILGARGGIFGDVYVSDDDGSYLGNGRASALQGINTNNGVISFAITGYPDETFDGSHGEEGEYEVFVVAYDSGGQFADSFSEIRTLQQDQIDYFTFDNFEWIGGTYDATIDNSTSGFYGDVDFFTFTGLSPGAVFTAQTTDPNFINIDTLLGWFDSTGSLILSDDDGASGSLSQLQGVVPATGMLTFAVTGFFDDNFIGSHDQFGNYELHLTFELTGDFDHDGDVDGHDFLVWQRNPSVGSLGDWQSQYGNGSLIAVTAVPEPTAAMLLALACSVILSARLSLPR